MATVADGGSATITVAESALLTVIVNGGSVRYENPVGTLVAEFSSDRVFGPLSAGSLKLSSVRQMGRLKASAIVRSLAARVNRGFS